MGSIRLAELTADLVKQADWIFAVDVDGRVIAEVLRGRHIIFRGPAAGPAEIVVVDVVIDREREQLDDLIRQVGEMIGAAA